MFIVLLTYKPPLETVDRHLAAHRAFLDKHYAAGDFIASGAQVPRTGGVILCRAKNREAVERIIAEDPFQAVASYQLIEFTPTKCASGFDQFLNFR